MNTLIKTYFNSLSLSGSLTHYQTERSTYISIKDSATRGKMNNSK